MPAEPAVYAAVAEPAVHAEESAAELAAHAVPAVHADRAVHAGVSEAV